MTSGKYYDKLISVSAYDSVDFSLMRAFSTQRFLFTLHTHTMPWRLSFSRTYQAGRLNISHTKIIKRFSPFINNSKYHVSHMISLLFYITYPFLTYLHNAFF